MRKLLPILSLFFVVALDGQTVSNIHFEHIGDSSMQVLFDVTGTFTEARVRWGLVDTAGATSNAYVQIHGMNAAYLRHVDQMVNISGMKPNTLHYVSPEVRNGGGAWSSGISATVTTLPRTNRTPIAPTPVDTTFPTLLNGLLTGDVLNVASDCHDFQDKIDAANPGDTILLAPGTVCPHGHYTLRAAPGRITFAAADFNPYDATINIPSTTFQTGDEVRFGKADGDLNCLPGGTLFAAPNHCDAGYRDGIRQGGRYWLEKTDANHVRVLDALLPSGQPVVPGWLKFTCNAGTNEIVIRPNLGFGLSSLAGAITMNSTFQVATTGTPCGGLNLNTKYFTRSALSCSYDTTCSVTLSLTVSGAAVDITDTGTGEQTLTDYGFGTMYMAPAAVGGKVTLITTSGTLPAVNGQTVTSADDAQMWTITKEAGDTSYAIKAGNMSRNYRIVGGRIASENSSTDYTTTIDPIPYGNFFRTYQDSENIVFDRMRFVGSPYPYRSGMNTIAYWYGRSMAILASDFADMHYWHPNLTSFTTSIQSAGTVARLPVHTLNMGASYFGAKTTSGNSDFTITGGTPTGTIITYYDMTGVMRTQVPAGTSGTQSCPGVTCSVVVAQTITSVDAGTNTFTKNGHGYINGQILYPGSDGTLPGGLTLGTGYTVYAATANTFKFTPCCGVDIDITSTGSGNISFTSIPVNAAVRPAGCIVARGTLTAGVVTAYDANSCYGSINNSEGTQMIINGVGPCPCKFHKNTVDSTGIALHFDDAGAGSQLRGDYTITQNRWIVPDAQNPASAGTDGLRYFHRQFMEWKGGSRILVEDNTFTGSIVDSSPSLVAIALTPINWATTSDVNYHRNTVIGAGGFEIGRPVTNVGPGAPVQRVNVSDNVFLINAYTHRAPGWAPNGWAFYGGYGIEDLTIDHNTVFDSRGAAARFLHIENNPIGGGVITNNIISVNGQTVTMAHDGIPGCGGSTNEAFLNCAFIDGVNSSGVVQPAYTFTKNLFVGSWLDTSVGSGSGVADATISAAWPTTIANNFIAAGASVAAKVAAIKFTLVDLLGTFVDLNLHLASDSPYKALGSDGLDIGYLTDPIFTIEPVGPIHPSVRVPLRGVTIR